MSKNQTVYRTSYKVAGKVAYGEGFETIISGEEYAIARRIIDDKGVGLLSNEQWNRVGLFGTGAIKMPIDRTQIAGIQLYNSTKKGLEGMAKELGLPFGRGKIKVDRIK